MRKLLLLITLVLVASQLQAQQPAVSIRNGTVDPTTCLPTSINIFYRSDTAALKICSAANTWTALSTGIPTYPLLAPNGTTAAPSYSFTNSTTNGMYLDSVGVLGLAASTDLLTKASTAAPTAPMGALAGAGAGLVEVGTHSYKVTFVTAGGESVPSTKSNVVTVADDAVNGQVAVTNIATGNIFVTSRKLYRTVAGDTGAWKLVTTIANNTATTFTDNVADAALTTAAPSTSTAIDTRFTIANSGDATATHNLVATSDVQAGDGGVNPAAFGFTSEPTLGLFRRGAGQLGVTANTTVGWFDSSGWHGTGTQIQQINAIAATSTDAVILTTNGTASAGAQQWSPRLRFTAQGWRTNAVAQSEAVDWIAEVQPVQGAADPSSNLVFSSQINAGGYTPRVTFTSGGTVTIPGAGATCTNQFVSAVSTSLVPTCTTDTLASAQHANQGTTTTVLHGNAAGNPAFGVVVDGDINFTAPALGAPTATTVQTSGNAGVGAAPSAVAGEMLVATDNFNGATIIRASNPDATDTGSLSAFEVLGGATVLGRLQAHQAGRTATRLGVTLANWVELFQSTGNGLLIDTTGANPVIMGTGGTRALTISGSTQAVSLRGSQTNDSATAGDVGELISGTVAANTTSLSTGSTANVGTNTNITLTAGDWDCTGVVNFTFGATTSITNLAGGISTTTATLPAQDSYFDYETSAIVPTGSAVATWVVPTVRISASGSTPVFLVSQATFTVSTIKVGGTIRCRRMR